MTYPYSVKVNGKWYRPNTEIPEKKVATSTVTVDSKAIAKAVDEIAEDKPKTKKAVAKK